jgi:hypothetical protein
MLAVAVAEAAAEEVVVAADRSWTSQREYNAAGVPRRRKLNRSFRRRGITAPATV